MLRDPNHLYVLYVLKLFLKEKENNYYLYFDCSLERGYHLTFKSADDPTLVLSKYGKYFYENLIIFAPTVQEFGGSLNIETITQFIDDGGKTY